MDLSGDVGFLSKSDAFPDKEQYAEGSRRTRRKTWAAWCLWSCIIYGRGKIVRMPSLRGLSTIATLILSCCIALRLGDRATKFADESKQYRMASYNSMFK